MSIQPTTSTLVFANHWDHFLARIGVKRNNHRVEPGLYALGKPNPDSPVLVTANYTLSFDALRSALAGIDAYIMVLDTRGINVWCAAGKGTFGTDELVSRIELTRLHEVVNHRVIILPQLGAAGVSAHEVKKRTKFKVEYGPVRADDLPEYLKTHQIPQEMRKVRFTLRDRLILIPVELANFFIFALIIILVELINGWHFPIEPFDGISAVLAGLILFPILIPWLPTHDFSTKGFILGVVVALPFVLLELFSHNPGTTLLRPISAALSRMLIWPSVTAFLALNFTGATTFTSRSGVRREIFKYIPVMAGMFGTGVILSIIFIIFKYLEVL